MISGKETISTYSKENMCIWMLMAFQAGLLNIGGFLACHKFVSHLTGFATLIGNEVATQSWSQGFRLLTVPIFFLMGVILSGLLVDVNILLKKRPKYYIVFSLIFFLTTSIYLLGINGFWGEFGNTNNAIKEYYLLTTLCFICGVQNGAITSASRYVIRTTHLTGLTTDLGIGIARIINFKQLDQLSRNEIKPTLMRISIIAFFTLGAFIGAFFFHHWRFAGFILPSITSGVLFFVIIYQYFKRLFEMTKK